jgi:2-polyprenyl-3-methyl-5-hydroxy-6-metoxy-1,4-benzoquinol methylase
MEIIKMRLGNNYNGLIEFVNFIKRFYDTKELTLLEIGSFTGESSEIFAQNFKKVTCIDSWVGKSVEMFLKTCTAKDIENKFDEMATKYDNIQKIKADSIETALKTKKKYDVIYIDGDHSFPAVKADIASWQDKARLIISGHDYNKNHIGVIKAVDQAFYKPDEIFKDNSWLRWIKRDSETLKYKYDENYTLNRIEGYKEFKAGQVHARKIAIANTFDVKGKNVFDVGFGRGELLKLCHDKGAYCYGIDFSKDAYEIAQKNEGLTLFNESITNIDKCFEGKSKWIDILFMIDIIEHISEKEFDEFIDKIKGQLSDDIQTFIHTPKDIHAGDVYNMHITQWTKQKLLDKFSFFKEVQLKENLGNYYLICKGLK